MEEIPIVFVILIVVLVAVVGIGTLVMFSNHELIRDLLDNIFNALNVFKTPS